MKPLWWTPVALLPAGCATLPHMPSVQASQFAEQMPIESVGMPSSTQAMTPWLLPAENPWAAFSRWTLFASLTDEGHAGYLPSVEQSTAVQRAEQLGTKVGREGLPPGTLWMLDLPGAESVAFGAALSREQPVSLVSLFQNWTYTNEAVPASQTLAALIKFPPQLPPSDVGPPVFLLDAWRLAYVDQELPSGLTDNRYALTEADLPSADRLRQLGIREVIYVVETRDGDTVEEDDLNVPLRHYQDAGIAVNLVSLDDLEGNANVASAVYSFPIFPRVTVLQDPFFYRRNRGGFGGWGLGYAHLMGGGGHGG